MRKHREQSLVTGRMWMARSLVPGFVNVDGDWGSRHSHAHSVGAWPGWERLRTWEGHVEQVVGPQLTGKVLARETQKSPKKRWK